MVRFAVDGAELQVRDESRRELEVRLLTWDETAETSRGLEAFAPGAFGDLEPADIVLRRDHADPALGRGIEYLDDGTAPRMVFRVDRSAEGDSLLAGVADGTYRAVSVGFDDPPGGPVAETVYRAGRRVNRIIRAALAEVSATWRPAYRSAAVLAVRSEDGNDMAEQAEQPAAQPAPEPAATPAPDYTAIESRLEQLEERARVAIATADVPEPAGADTMERRVRYVRELEDIVTSDVPGIVPDAMAAGMIGIIDDGRPFLASTRRLETPAAGTRLLVPVLDQRPLVGEQDEEKTDVPSRTVKIDTADFPMRTFSGAADISMQLLRRSSPEFRGLFGDLLAEAYAIVTDAEAVKDLLAATDVNEGTATFDPLTGDVSFGEAFTNAQAVSRRMFPDTLWLSTAAIAAMIDAKTDGTNTPMFGSLNLTADSATGVSGRVSGLRAVHVPALDDEAVDAIVGPSRGFAWAEDGTYTLEADVPAKFGRDVGLGGMIWFAPWYPAAFTTYAL